MPLFLKLFSIIWPLKEMVVTNSKMSLDPPLRMVYIEKIILFIELYFGNTF